MNTKKLTMAALLTALAIIIPFVIIFKVTLPPFFTATLGAHVPMFLSMLLGPEVAIMVGLGSTLGFFLNVGPEVAARAFMHVFVGLLGAVLLRRKMSFKYAIIITAPIHGFLELAVSLAILKVTNKGIDLELLLIGTFLGTIIHHFIDSFISYFILMPLRKSRLLSVDDTVFK